MTGPDLPPPDCRLPALPVDAQAPSWQCVLDIDVELAEALTTEALPAARSAAIVRTFGVDPGRLPVPAWLNAASPGPGVLMLEGVMAVEVQVDGRTSAELVGAGDLVQPIACEFDEMLSCEVSWRAVAKSRFALLDHDFARRVRFWPQIHQALLRRVARRTANLNVQRTIAAQPRLELRLALLLWHLAARWGKVERGGIRLPVPLTHHLLGHLIAAERPSVTHALARLAHAGIVTGHGDEWHLHGHLEEQLGTIRDHGRINGGRVAAAATSWAV